MARTHLFPAETRYSPLYFLASLGAGGIAVTFFLWLMFWIPHPGKPVPVFEDIAAAFSAGRFAQQAMIGTAMAGIALFAATNLRLLAWNIGQLRRFRDSGAQDALSRTNAQTQMTALPLALAMSVNVGFILGLVFVPGLWGVTEYLFPAAMAVFVAIGVLALRQIGSFLGRVLSNGNFDHSANNSFAQKLPAFALAMVGVGLAAPAAMSSVPTTVAVSLALSTFFLASAAVIALVALVLGLHAMLEHGVAPEAAPTLMVIVPILTVLGILVMRQQHGLHVHFGWHSADADTLVLLTRLLSVQVLFTLFGVFVLARIGYVARFVTGAATSAGAYALICPAVALSVMMQFWINKGLVGAGVLDKFGAAYWSLSAMAVAVQAVAIGLALYLNRRHFRPAAAVLPHPAE
ncbi:hypothetical protein DKT77_09210 [Meridianimarinicoccus roseus]|uniref:Uncharacterized protein n=1 Tax=Meridianimarinicoccus roseus TaxID=2072018 RepID=A0A2V2LC73_9RHOB|nr:hypothetical protein [Meridianimarinicoccus roseus]PWR02752.1 hypothetical protein DKT77_09210 [Meridianimarinicoccus roseus]